MMLSYKAWWGANVRINGCECSGIPAWKTGKKQPV